MFQEAKKTRQDEPVVWLKVPPIPPELKYHSGAMNLTVVLVLAALGSLVRGDEGNSGHNLRGAGDAESNIAEKTAFQPRPEAEGTRPSAGCRGWVECVNGYWGNFRCIDGRYCRGGWEGDDNKAAEIEEKAKEESAKEQKSAFQPGRPEAEGTRPSAGCRGWVECVNGYWGNFRCIDGRYCRGGWEGDDNKAAEIEEKAKEESGKEQKSAFQPGRPEAEGTRPSAGCRGWVECVNGYWGNFRCIDGRYCRGGWEGDDNKAAEIEEKAKEESGKEQKSAFQPGRPEAEGTRPSAGCRGWVECVNGYWGNFRCIDGRYCRGGWEGDDNKAAEIEEKAKEESAKEQKSAFQPGRPEAEGTRPSAGCRGWVECVNGYWGNFRCIDGRYCRGGWEGDDNKAAEIEEKAKEESAKEQKSAFQPGRPEAEGTRPSAGCRGWVECVNGYWGNFRCIDGRYCRGGWEGDDNKAAEIEEEAKEESAKHENSVFVP